MLLENLSFLEVEDYLQENDTVLIPVGSVEQHSPYGIIGTDFIAAAGVAQKIGEKLGLLVAPTISYGVSPHHMGFSGSVTLSPTTYIQVICDVVNSFIEHGFRRIYFINGHGGNKSPIETAFQQLKMAGARGQLALTAWYEGLKESQLIEELFEEQDGSHATPSEISLTMVFRPEVFAEKKTLPGEVEKKDHIWPMTAEEMRKTFPDGRIGAASWLASADKGTLLLKLAVETLAERIEKLQLIPLE